MLRQTLLFCFLTVAAGGWMNAQNWTKDDSIWLRSVLEGREDIKINEETKKAIEEGRLIVPPWMKNSENQVEKVDVLKDFEDAGKRDSSIIHVDPYSMPPGVFALYVLYMNKVDSINESMTCLLSAEEQERLASFLPPEARNGFYVSGTAGGVGGMNFNHLLSMVFSPSYRRKAHNAKHAVAYKNYYDAGMMQQKGLTDRERREIRRDLNNFKLSKNASIGMKTHGIDD